MRLPAVFDRASRARADAFFERLREAQLVGGGAPDIEREGGAPDADDLPLLDLALVRAFFAQAKLQGLSSGVLDQVESRFGELPRSEGRGLLDERETEREGLLRALAPGEARSGGEEENRVSREQFRLGILLTNLALAEHKGKLTKEDRGGGSSQSSHFHRQQGQNETQQSLVRHSAARAHRRRQSLLDSPETPLFRLEDTLLANFDSGALPSSLLRSLYEAPESVHSVAESESPDAALSHARALAPAHHRVAPNAEHHARHTRHPGGSGATLSAYMSEGGVTRSDAARHSPDPTSQGSLPPAAHGHSGFRGHGRQKSIVSALQAEEEAKISDQVHALHQRHRRELALHARQHSAESSPLVEAMDRRGSVRPNTAERDTRRHTLTTTTGATHRDDAPASILAVGGVARGEKAAASRRLFHRANSPVPIKKGSTVPSSLQPQVPQHAGDADATPPERRIRRSMTMGPGPSPSATSSGPNYDVNLSDIVGKQPVVSPRHTAAAGNDYFGRSAAARKESAALMSAAMRFLDRGLIHDAQSRSSDALEALRPFAHLFDREVEVCRGYVAVTTLLIEIRFLDECAATIKEQPGESSLFCESFRCFAALFARFCGEISSLQPTHRIICIRMAAQRNFELCNYGVAAKFIRLLLPLQPLDASTLAAKLQICASSNFVDENLPPYRCAACSRDVSPGGSLCPVCHSTISSEPLLKRSAQLRVERLVASEQPVDASDSVGATTAAQSSRSSKPKPKADSPQTDKKTTSNVPMGSLIDLSSSVEDVLSPQQSSPGKDDSAASAQKKTTRTKTVFEILESERSYVQGLDVLVNMYLKPLRQAMDNPKSKGALALEKNQLRSMFGDIEVIHAYNSKFLAQLEHRMSKYNSRNLHTQKISDIILSFVPFMKTYASYVEGAGLAFVTASELQKSNPEFSQFCDENKVKSGLDLASYLIQPVQRIPRYVLLLRDVLKRTKESHPDYDGLRMAHEKVSEVASYVNEHKRDADNMQQVFAIQERLVGLDEPLMQPHRRFLHKGPVKELRSLRSTVRASASRFLLLFNDILLICKPVTLMGTSHIATDAPPLRESDDEKVVYRVKRVLHLTSVYVANWTEIAGLRLTTGAVEKCFQLTISKRHSGIVAPPLKESSGAMPALSSHSDQEAKGRYVFLGGSQEVAAGWVSVISAAVARLGDALSQRDELLPSAGGLGLADLADEQMTEYEWLLLLTNAVTETLPKGTVLMRQFERGLDEDAWQPGSGRLFRIQSGHVVATRAHHGKVLFEEKLGPGSVFGFSAFLGHKHPNKTVTVESAQCRVSAIDAAFVIRLLRVEPTIASKFYQMLAVHFADLLRATGNLDRTRAGNISYVYAPNDLSKSVVDRSALFFRLFPHFALEVAQKQQDNRGNAQSAQDPRSVLVHQHFQCGYTRNLTYRGDLFVLHDVLAFSGHLFGRKKQKIIRFSSVISVARATTHTASSSRASVDLPGSSADQLSGEDARGGAAMSNPELALSLTLRDHRRGTKQAKLHFEDDFDLKAALTAIENLLKLSRMGGHQQETADASRESSDANPSPASVGPPLLASGAVDTPADIPSAIAKSTGLAAFTTVDASEDELTREDWSLIMRNATFLTFKAGAAIVSEGKGQQRIFQVVSGSCRAEKTVEGRNEKVVVGVMGPGDVFGEETFLVGGRSDISVIANARDATGEEEESADLTVYSVDGRSMRLLFEIKPGLAGRFRRYLGIVLERRVREQFRLMAAIRQEGKD